MAARKNIGRSAGLILASVLVVFAACTSGERPHTHGEEGPTGGQPVVYLSEALPNRAGVDTADVPYARHGVHCAGFYRMDVDPTAVHHTLQGLERPVSFERDASEALRGTTGFLWRRVETSDSIIDFTRYHTPAVDRAAYLAELVSVPETGPYTLMLSSDDGVTVYVDGDSVYSRHVGRELRVGSDLVPLTLSRGVHTLLFKVDQGDGGWGLYRRLAPGWGADAALERLVPDLYADLPAASILADTARYVALRPDPRRRLDRGRTVSFEWRDLRTGRADPYESEGYTAAVLPERIRLPAAFGTSTELIVIVRDAAERVVFRERFALFREAEARRLASSLTAAGVRPGMAPHAAALREAVQTFFGSGRERPRSYSTRLQAEALADLAYGRRQGGPPRPLVTRAFAGIEGRTEIYRLFVPSVPDSGAGRRPLAFVSYGIKGSGPFWAGKEVASHALTARRAALSVVHDVLIAMPHGRTEAAYVADFGLSARDLAEDGLACDSAAVSVLVYSDGMKSLLDAMARRKQPFGLVGAVSPVFPSGEARRTRLVACLRAAYPGLRWFIRSGLDDAEAPIHRTRRWVEALREAGYEVDYREEPHASHWSYPLDPEPAFFEQAAAIGSCRR